MWEILAIVLPPVPAPQLVQHGYPLVLVLYATRLI
jgi:hypothetical protein